MSMSAKIITALSVAALVGVAGSAFTAASSVDAATKYVGATGQAISGVTVSKVQYTTSASTDITTAVTFHVLEELSAADVVTATLTGFSADGVTPVTSAEICEGVYTVAGTDLTCTFTTTVKNVNKLDIVAS